jgi:colicin import membrane protein
MSSNTEQVPNQADLWLDMKQSILWHGAIMVMGVVYLLICQLSDKMFTTKASRIVDHAIGVEFVDLQQLQKRQAPESPQVQPIDIQKPLPESRPPEPIKSQEATKQSLEDGNMSSKNPSTDKRKMRTTPAAQLQRQATMQSSMTKTSTARQINTRKAVGSSRMASQTGQSVISKPQKTKSNGGATETNAQVLAAKKTESSAMKMVQSSQVKKSTDRLAKEKTALKSRTQTAKATLAKQKQTTMSDAAKRQQEATKRQLEAAKRKQDAIKRKQEAVKRQQAAAKRAQQLAYEKQQAEQAAEKKRIRDAKIMQTIQHYGQLMTNKIQQTALFNPGMQGLQARLKVQLKLDGQVQSVGLAQSSGNDSFDRLAINAVYKAAPLPLPEDQEISQQMAQINLVIRPGEIG